VTVVVIATEYPAGPGYRFAVRATLPIGSGTPGHADQVDRTGGKS